jgi:hypothetical protein
MSELHCNEILPVLLKDFGTLWKCRQRGDTLEIITPFSTATQKFVSIFITERNDALIVSDGGWLEDEIDFYGVAPDVQDEEYRALIRHFSDSFDISALVKPNGGSIFYRKCDKRSLLSSAVYDVSNFVASVVNSASVRNEDIAETERKSTFRSKANEYLNTEFHGRVQFNQSIDGLDKIKFNAVLVYSAAYSLICYVTGSTPHYFTSDLRRAIVNFELANSCRSNQFIRSRVALLDDDAVGYERGRGEELLGLLATHKGKAIRWSDKARLREAV